MFDIIKGVNENYQVYYNNKCVDTIIPEERDGLRILMKRKPDIFRINHLNKHCDVIEVTVCYDLYFSYALKKKENDYTNLCRSLQERGYSAKLKVLCFGSLGNVEINCYENLKDIITNKTVLKDLLKWCSISAIIGSNYIWRKRVKMLFA